MANKNTILLNGKTYDALTGKLFSDITPAAVSSLPSKPAHAAPKTAIHVDIKHQSKHIKRAPTHTSHQLHKKHEKAHTLRRELVSKPAHLAPKPKAKSTPTKSNTVPQKAEAKVATFGPSPERLLRANAVAKSKIISRFGDISVNKVTKIHKPLAVSQVPNHAISAVSGTVSPEITAKPPTSSNDLFTSAMYADHSAAFTAHHSKAKRSVFKKLSGSHKLATLASGGFAVLLFVGFFGYLNSSNIAMRVAARNAGIDARLPAVVAGYEQGGPIHYSPGQITISFQSTSDSRKYVVEERASSWNSEALRANFVSMKNSPYQTALDRGRTIFLYGKGSATWVDGGIWFNIEGNEHLSPEQLLKISASL